MLNDFFNGVEHSDSKVEIVEVSSRTVETFSVVVGGVIIHSIPAVDRIVIGVDILECRP